MNTEFIGNERFSVVRRLGAGGMGVVYEAIDTDRDCRIALKTIVAGDATSIYRFKQEFRSLVEIVHPNLVTLYELFSDSETFFFTMELVNGVDLLTYVRHTAERIGWANTNLTSSLPVNDRDTIRMVNPATVGDADIQCNIGLLRRCLMQLIQGVVAIHDAGKLHRDLKPSNILVTTAGRVRILDFGLVMEMNPAEQSRQDMLAGTAAYMAPEQAMGKTLSEATDWYAVGVILYEALTGVLPYSGSLIQIIQAKQQIDPNPPSTLVQGVPPELERLCLQLLQRDPQKRPGGQDILRILGESSGEMLKTIQPRAEKKRTPFVGRSQEMTVLREAFKQSVSSRTVMANVHGQSGYGKSELIRRVLADIASESQVVILKGRCYEQESVPYKAVDSIIDSLSHYLASLSSLDAGVLIPREIHSLVRMFPVLGRVPAVISAPIRPESPDPLETRRRAFGALREFFQRISDRHSLILWMDDLQWSDVDSASLIAEFLRPPDAPALLLIACYRSEGSLDNPALVAIKRAVELLGSGIEVFDIPIGPLQIDESQELIRQLRPATTAESIREIARESFGSPFLVGELIRYCDRLRILDRPHDGLSLRLEEMFAERIVEVSPTGRRLIEVVAVAGERIPRVLAFNVSSPAPVDERSVMAELRAGYWIRTSRTGGVEFLDTMHDKIRESIMMLLSDDARRSIHRKLAEGMEDSTAGPELLATHWFNAGDTDKAAAWAECAGNQAMASLAFDQAAKWFQSSIDWRTPSGESLAILQRKRGEALAHAGLGGEAGKAFLTAASGFGGDEQLALLRRAAEQLLQSGYIREGMVPTKEVLRKVGVWFPKTPLHAFIGLLFYRFLLRLRGFRFQKRAENQIPRLRITRGDICWSLSKALSQTDFIRGHYFASRNLFFALADGEPNRIMRGLCVEMVSSSVGAQRTAAKTARILALIDRIVPTIEGYPPEVLAAARNLSVGWCSHLMGEFDKSIKHCRIAMQIMHDHCSDVAWEIAVAQETEISSLFLTGRIRELSQRAPEYVKHAVELGDLFQLTQMLVGPAAFRWLAIDDPVRAEREIEQGLANWPITSFDSLHAVALITRTIVDVYQNRPAIALERLDAQYNALKWSFVLKVELVKALFQIQYAQTILATAAAKPRRGPTLRKRAARIIRTLKRIPLPWSNAMATALQAVSTAQAGDRDSAIDLFTTAIRGLEDHSLNLFAAAAKYRCGELIGESRGNHLIEEALTFMRLEEIRNPRRMLGTLLPGFGLTATSPIVE